MNNQSKTGKALCALLVFGMLTATPSVWSEAAVITSNATDKIAVVFQENTAYNAGDYIIYDSEMYICTADIQGPWETAESSFMQITKNREIGTQSDLSASYDAAKDPSQEKSLMAFAANAWQKIKVFFGMESKEEDVNVNEYKNASVSAKLNFLQKQNQQLDQNVANLQGWITQSFTSVSNVCFRNPLFIYVCECFCFCFTSRLHQILEKSIAKIYIDYTTNHIYNICIINFLEGKMEESDILDVESEKEDIEQEGIAMELLRDLKEHNHRMDEHNKRLISALKISAVSFGATVILVVGMFFFGILSFLNQYEFENYSQDGGGYNNINTGEQGDLYNGAEISEDEKEERQSEGNDSQETVQ